MMAAGTTENRVAKVKRKHQKSRKKERKEGWQETEKYGSDIRNQTRSMPALSRGKPGK